jgi:TPP-dependent pyruvate/acetoin dehydrogenase alpha subunit
MRTATLLLDDAYQGVRGARLPASSSGVYSGAGQEAIVTRICAALQDGDFVAPLHRDLGVFLVRGVDPGRLMAQLTGKETGLSRGKD